MRTKVTAAARRIARLTRILEALEKDLVEASDEEILEAAKDLGMNPKMRGSAAFIGVKTPTRWQLEDFFGFERVPAAQITTQVKDEDE
jgi:hypothetical protein